MVCPRCHHRQLFDFMICPKCGINFNEESDINSLTKCSSCGAGITNDDVFCPKCGTKLSIPELPPKVPYEIQDIDYSNWTISPRLYGTAVFFLLFPLFFKINFFLIAFIECGAWFLLLLTQTELLLKYNFISRKFNLGTIIKNGLKGKAVLSGIIVVEICLLYLSFITSESYKLNKFHQEVQTLIQNNKKIELNDLFKDKLKESSNESVMYIINQAIIFSNKPFLDSIVSDFGILPDAIQDSVVKIFTKAKLPIYSANYLASRLLLSAFGSFRYDSQNSDFGFNKAEGKVVVTINKTVLEIEVAKQLKTMLDNASSVNEKIRVIDRTVQPIRNYFRTSNDSIWCSIQLKLWDIDSLFKYSKNELDMPDKPIYHKPTFDAPDHLSGYVIPYDGGGVLIGSYPKFYVIEGAEKDMSGYFDGYVTKTDRTTSIYSKANGSTWDATICEYISTSEYNETVASYRQEQADAISNYKAEMKEYNASVSYYKSYMKNAPLIKAKIVNLFNSINLSINQIIGKS